MSMLRHSRSLVGNAGAVLMSRVLAFNHCLLRRNGSCRTSTKFSSLLSHGVSERAQFHSSHPPRHGALFVACTTANTRPGSPAWCRRLLSSEPPYRQPLKKAAPSSIPSPPSSSVGEDQAKAPEDEVKKEVEELYYTFGPLRMRQVNVNFPNFLTVVRIAMALPVGYLFYAGHHELAFYGFFVAGACDFFDGYFARKWNQKTVLGAMLDPAADKLLVASLALPMAITGAIPLWLCALIVGRDVGLMAVGFWHRFKTRTPGSFLFDTKEVNFTVEATNLSKLNMALQSLLIMSTLTHAAFEFPAIEPLSYLQYAVGATTAGSWLQYTYIFFHGDAYKNRDDVE